jgi:AHBA synthesis associated protein
MQSIVTNVNQLTSIIFDLDGVLIDSKPLMCYAFKEAYRQVIGEGEPPLEEYFLHLGDFFPNIMQKMGLPIEMWEPFRTISSQRLDLVRLFPGIRELLNQITSSCINMAILTGKDCTRTEQILLHFDLQDYFQIVVTPEIVSRPKPCPDGLIYILTKFDCPVNQAVFVGDSVNDMLCAQQAGMQSVAALWGANVKVDQVIAMSNYQSLSPWGFLMLLKQELGLRSSNRS